jgi:acyl-CoA reductase-like NAD-dependent aldehyde dehydrogenase
MTYRTINPATGEPLKTYEDISDAALNEVMEVAQACYENDWRRRSGRVPARWRVFTSFRRSVHSGEAAQPPHIGSGC